MFICGVCRFHFELDDVTLPGANGFCVCLGCYLRETGQWQIMPKALRQEVTAIVAAAGEESAPVLRFTGWGFGR